MPQQEEAPHRKSTNQPDATKRVPPILKHVLRPLRWRYLKIFDRAILHAGLDGHRSAADLAVHNELRGFMTIQLALEVLLAMRAGDGDEQDDQSICHDQFNRLQQVPRSCCSQPQRVASPKSFSIRHAHQPLVGVHGLPVDYCPICNDSLPISLNAARWSQSYLPTLPSTAISQTMNRWPQLGFDLAARHGHLVVFYPSICQVCQLN